ncbi:MAG: DUF3298 and DUF4163 domain-containing protein [Muribaculaceae bacterium]|nr:DUF3298 and DUF4163 domain-containing protein [Muribaculaceae bacterium]
MKRIAHFAAYSLLAAAFALTSSNSAYAAEAAAPQAKQAATQKTESAIKTGVFSAKVPNNESSLTVEYPVDGPAALVESIRGWINESLGGDYKGNLANVNDVAKFYEQKLRNNEDIEYGGYEIYSIKKAYENSKVITFVCDFEMYGGGAHGMASKTGATFLKSNGKMLTNDMLTNWTGLRPTVMAGLKKYFKVNSNAKLREIIGRENMTALPMPSANPWITAKGLVINYSQYEICAYAYGSPTVVIPAVTAKSFFNATGKSFF